MLCVNAREGRKDHLHVWKIANHGRHTHLCAFGPTQAAGGAFTSQPRLSEIFITTFQNMLMCLEEGTPDF